MGDFWGLVLSSDEPNFATLKKNNLSVIKNLMPKKHMFTGKSYTQVISTVVTTSIRNFSNGNKRPC